MKNKAIIKAWYFLMLGKSEDKLPIELHLQIGKIHKNTIIRRDIADNLSLKADKKNLYLIEQDSENPLNIAILKVFPEDELVPIAMEYKISGFTIGETSY